MKLRNKRIVSLFLSLALVLGIMTGATPAFAEEAKVLTIVHVNDVHGNVAGNDTDIIGYEKLKTIVDDLKNENPNVLLLNAGDTLHGTNLATLNRGEAIVNLMNLIGFDAMVPGNHEFNYGYERLLELSKMAKFPFLGANIIKEEDNTSDFESFVIKEFDGIKVGIFGISTEETKVKAHPNYTEGIKFESPIEVSEKMVKKLQEEKVDIIIALTHLGIDEESKLNGATIATDVAEKVQGIDIIVDGHSHSNLPEGLLVGDTLIVQAHEWTKKVGMVEIEIVDGKVANKTAKLLDYEGTKDIVPDPVIGEEIEKIDAENKLLLERVIGKTKVKLEGTREVVRANESNLGNLLTDAMLQLSNADVAITNGGGIRASIEEGDITVGDVQTVFPFANYPVVIEVTGKTLLEALEFGVDSYPEVAGKFPHVAGMKYKIDPNKEIGSRIVDLIVGDEPINLEAKYKVVTNDFMGAGGDGYEMFKGAPILAEYGLLSEVVINYIEELGEIEPKVEGRVIGLPLEEVPVEEPTPAEEKYTVKPGDVLWKIAEKFNTTWEKLAEYNNLKNPHLIFPNQIILIP